MKALLFTPLFLLLLLGCKKDCLEKDKCSPSTYSSAYLIEFPTPVVEGTAYYIDAENGKKKNAGTSESDAFETIEDLEEIEFQPGDQILFKRGQFHFGELQVSQSGTVSKPIYISAYGTGELPIVKTSKNTNHQAIHLFNADYVIIQNLNVQGGGLAILLAGSDHCIIEGCRIGENSLSGIRATGQHSESEGSNFGIIQHCLIYSGLSGATGDLQGTDGLQLMDGASNWVVTQNEIKAWAHSAVSIKPIYTAFVSNNNIVSNNLIDCGDIDYMRALDITGPENRASNNLFINNIVRNQTVTTHLHGNDNKVAYNLFLGLKSSDATEQPWAIDFHVFIGNSGGTDRTEYVCFNNGVYNNLFYNFNGGVGIRYLNSKSGTSNQVHDNEVVNNIFYNITHSIEMDTEPTGEKITNNVFYNSSGSVLFRYNNIEYSLLDFETLNGTNGHQLGANLNTNPDFTNALLEDFKLQLSSIAINNGIDVGFEFDFDGNAIIDTPDIGPKER